MTQKPIQGENFEERALSLLKAEVAERGAREGTPATVTPAWRRRGPRLALAGTAIAAIAATALIVNAGRDDTPVAFAVEPGPEGMISVEVNGLEDAEGLEAALDDAGIPASVNYLPDGMACKEPRFRPVPLPDGVGALVKAMMRGEGPNGGPPFVVSGPLTFSINREAVQPGQTLVITASASDDGKDFEGSRGFFASGYPVELAEGAVAPCEPVPAPSDGSAGGG